MPSSIRQDGGAGNGKNLFFCAHRRRPIDAEHRFQQFGKPQAGLRRFQEAAPALAGSRKRPGAGQAGRRCLPAIGSDAWLYYTRLRSHRLIPSMSQIRNPLYIDNMVLTGRFSCRVPYWYLIGYHYGT